MVKEDDIEFGDQACGTRLRTRAQRQLPRRTAGGVAKQRGAIPDVGHEGSHRGDRGLRNTSLGDVNHWDGWSNAVITDLGGETFTLDVATITPSLLTFLDQNPDCGPLDIDGSLADEFVQLGLFGLVIYRSEISKRPKTAHHRATASL